MEQQDRKYRLQKAMSCAAIPSMPGTRPGDAILEKHHKPQRFKMQDGRRVEEHKPGKLDKAMLVSPMASMAELYQEKEELLKKWEAVEQQMLLKKHVDSLAPIQQTSEKSMASSKSMPSLRVPPSWLKNDREVLRFYMYFKEAVHESAVENHRVRRCVLNYYLADQTISIQEPKEENSGLPQGVFLKRTCLAKEDGKTPYQPGDFLIGTEITIFGRRFRVVDYDEKTRNYLSDQGFPIDEPEVYPDDPHRRRIREALEMAANKTKLTAINGRGCGKDASWKNDQKVLSFQCLWDDTNRLYGEKNFYQLRYFLHDDTIEIKAINQSQQGKDSYPLLLKKSKLIKNMEDPSQGYYEAKDLICGDFVNCWGRQLMLLKCDSFTQKYYQRVHGFEQPIVKIKQPPRKIIKKEIPPYNGFGSEADSLANCLNLVPKPVSQDLHRFLNNRGKVLRFKAKFTNPKPEDVDRRFLITYFMDDDTCSVYEPPLRNSGIIGGKFLERGRYKKPIREKKSHASDLNALKTTILDKIQSRMVGGPYALLRAFRKFGTDEKGCISFENFKIGLRSIGILPTAFSDEQLRRLFSMYDKSGDDSIDYQEFVDHVMMDKPIATNQTRFSSRWIRGADFFVGTKVTFMFPQTGACTQEFEVLSADKQTLDLMAQHPDEFPKSNLDAIANMLADTLSENHVNVNEAFRVIDQEGKGWIYPEQFGQLLKHWSLEFGLIGEDLTSHETLTLVRHYDKDGDGRIFYNEFAAALKKKKAVDQVEKKAVSIQLATEALFERLQPLCEFDDVESLFKAFDLDGSGRIALDEFSMMLERYDIFLTKDDKAFLMLRFDRNSDGLIDLNEFIDALFNREIVNEGGGPKTKLVPKDPQELRSMSQAQLETEQGNILEYQALLEVSQYRDSESVRLKSMMKGFTAAYLGRKTLLLKVLRSYDIDRTGFVTLREFSEALSRANPDFCRGKKAAIISWVFKEGQEELDYELFLDVMLSQDVSKALQNFGRLPSPLIDEQREMLRSGEEEQGEDQLDE